MMRKTKSTLKQCAALVSSLSVLACLVGLFVFLRANTDVEEESAEEYENISLASLTDERRAVDISSLFWDYTVPFVYDGRLHTVKLCGIPEGIEVEYSDNSFTDSGYYLAKYELIYDKTKICITGVAPSPLEWQIERAAADISGITVADKTVEHDGGGHTLDVITDGTDGAFPIIPEEKTDIGEYEISVYFEENENYIPISPIVRRLVITAPSPKPSEENTGEKFISEVYREALGGCLLIVNIAASAAVISLCLLLAFAFIERREEHGGSAENESEEESGEKGRESPTDVCFEESEETPRNDTPAPLPDMRDFSCGIELSCEKIYTGSVKCGALYVRYRTTFTARLIRAGEDAQEKYGRLKNCLLSYKGIKSRVSEKHETFSKGKRLLAKINIKGKKVVISLALNPEDFDEKYKLETPSASDIESGLYLALKVKGARTLAYALMLIDTLMNRSGIPFEAPCYEDYKMPYEDSASLARRGLLKLILPEGRGEEISYTNIRAADVEEHIAATSISSLKRA